MSTFDGIVAEFPDIRVDFFRPSPHRQAPLACFLSHVHSDHLAGLESLRSPFVYCSAATRQILLRLERYPCRINFAKGILEARVQTFKKLRFLLKPIPLDTPTCLELAPGRHIRVTLFDANHCPGAVMFLLEGDGKAVLYTGDVRCEPWFVNSVARNPSLVEYSSHIKTLDKIYLDTSILDDIPLQTKADGIAELVRKIVVYPPGTIFHVQAWTYGYEEVWIALSKALNSRIHVDDYKMNIFQSLKSKPSPADRFSSPPVHFCPEAPALTGFVCGNTEHPGCLTSDENVHLHSCERGNFCSVVEKGPVVWIQPIVAHLPDGVDRLEVGIGGGGEDLEREVEIDVLSKEDLSRLLRLVTDDNDIPADVRASVSDYLVRTTLHGRSLSLDLFMSSLEDKNEASLRSALASLTKKSQLGRGEKIVATNVDHADHVDGVLPDTVTFPYSRHSSYEELCHLVQTFMPRDVWPCTVDPIEWHKNNITIKSLFGRHCSGDTFAHDLHMEDWASRNATDLLTQSHSELETQGSSASALDRVAPECSTSSPPKQPSRETSSASRTGKRTFIAFHDDSRDGKDKDPLDSQVSTESHSSEGASLFRADAYNTMMRNLAGGDWTPIELMSTSNHHTDVEKNPAHLPGGGKDGDVRNGRPMQ
ncbi:artemis protein [Sodiomyces alkalinus F11]|uniref:Artemis protein n=1 Tax=Sodiomyces alkalinus (strain CBS 110278 / VKM F-3762 / F11) TaxID=1314773 RepID=A0A3N2PPJ1_SODAK|nr:artemis protein [Sodiomyces alkalinus F11]ROT36425.1 artemis protein [Sodiomyces alkalinus F11]